MFPTPRRGLSRLLVDVLIDYFLKPHGSVDFLLCQIEANLSLWHLFDNTKVQALYPNNVILFTSHTALLQHVLENGFIHIARRLITHYNVKYSTSLLNDTQRVTLIRLRKLAIGTVSGQTVLIQSSRLGYVALVVKMIQQYGIDPSVQQNSAIKWAIGCRKLHVVHLLLQYPKVDPSSGDNYVLNEAATHGYIELFPVLLQDRRFRSSDFSQAFILASQNGHINLVRLLLQDRRVDPATDNNDAVILASENGHADIVQLLLQDTRVDPAAYDNEAIRHANEKGHHDVVRLLAQDPRVDASVISQ